MVSLTLLSNAEDKTNIPQHLGNCFTKRISLNQNNWLTLVSHLARVWWFQRPPMSSELVVTHLAQDNPSGVSFCSLPLCCLSSFLSMTSPSTFIPNSIWFPCISLNPDETWELHSLEPSTLDKPQAVSLINTWLLPESPAHWPLWPVIIQNIGHSDISPDAPFVFSRWDLILRFAVHISPKLRSCQLHVCSPHSITVANWLVTKQSSQTGKQSWAGKLGQSRQDVHAWLPKEAPPSHSELCTHRECGTSLLRLNVWHTTKHSKDHWCTRHSRGT